MNNPFVWHGVEHEIQISYNDDRYGGWFDVSVGFGVMREEGYSTFDELVEHWQSEMRKKN